MSSRWTTGVVLVATAVLGGGAMAAPLTATSTETTRLRELGDRLPTARLLWVRNNKIYHSPIADFAEQRITTGGNEEQSPHWSPDGSQIVFTRLPMGVWIMNSDFSEPRLVIPNGVEGTWTRDGSAITAINAVSKTEVIRLELGSNQTTTIYDSTDSVWDGKWGSGDELRQAAELRTGGGRFLLTFTSSRGTGNTHHTYVIDLQEETYIYNEQMARGDCNPVWAPDGSYIIQTARLSPNRGVYKSVFRPAANPPRFDDGTDFFGLTGSICAGCSTYYNHGEHISNDGAWLVTGGEAHDGPLDGNYEIFVWKIGEPRANAVRVTFDDVDDLPADLYVFPAAPPPVDAGLADDLGGQDDAMVADAAGPPDASRPDANRPDANRPDANLSDKGDVGDAGTIADAEIRRDAARQDLVGDDVDIAAVDPLAPHAVEMGAGLSCSARPNPTGWIYAALPALLLLRRRR